MIGERFGRLVVIGRGSRPGGSYWHVRCDCGSTKEVRRHALRTGSTRSCGCLQTEARITHGLTGHALYPLWASMIQRCENSRDADYAEYGARGITVCKAWRESFQRFLADVGERPRGGSLERVRNNGPYAPGNVRWASQGEQMRNTRSNRVLVLGGHTACLAEHAERRGLRANTVLARLRRGWSVERALTEMVQGG